MSSKDVKDIYRSKALERLSSPEAVDQLLDVVGPRDWLPLIAIGLLLAVAITWGFVGSIPASVSGRGVVVHPLTMREIQTTTAGRLESLAIQAGNNVIKNDVIGRIDQSDLIDRLQQDRALLQELRRQDRSRISLDDRQTALQKQQDEVQRNYLELQASTLRKSLQDNQAIAPVLKRRLEGYQTLLQNGLISPVSIDLLQSQQAVLDSETKEADINARLKQVEQQLKELETLEAEAGRENAEAATTRAIRIRELESSISLNESQLNRGAVIRSEYSGRVIEVTATAGQFLNAGSRLAVVEVDEAERNLVSVSYFPVGDGKKIKRGMTIHVTPDTVERQRFTGVPGVVDSVSDLPVTREAALLTVGNPAVVDALIANGPVIQVTSKLQTDPAMFGEYNISAGLTTSSRVVTEERKPISYIFPFLRSLSGIY